MVGGFAAGSWRSQIAVAVSYGIGVTLFRQLSISHWLILTGFHLAVLLLVDRRYWFALVVGEAVSLAHMSLTNADQMGTTWAVLNVVPSIVFMMPIVHLFRSRWPIVTKDAANMSALLACALLLAFLMSGYDIMMLALTKLPPGYVVHYGELAARWWLGNFLGVLTLTPMLLCVYLFCSGHSWMSLGSRLAWNGLLIESGMLLAPILLLLVWVALMAPANASVRQLAQIGLFVPVVWLTLRHGWQGAAIGGTLASTAITALMPERYDHHTLQAQVFIAFAISTMLLLGERIAVLRRRSETERLDLRMALALAQRNMQSGETQLRMASHAVEQARETVNAGFVAMSTRLRHTQPDIDDSKYQRRALVAQDQLYRVADGLYPVAWGHQDLTAMIREGAIARMLGEAGIGYWSELRGPLDRLSPALRLAIYRVACESVAALCNPRDVSRIGLYLRCRKHGRQSVMLRVEAQIDQARADKVQWEELLPHLHQITSGLGLQAIHDRAVTYEGACREKRRPDGRRISVLLREPEAPGNT
ncbi:MASE1 domain-containing protein [Dyella agri]|uniref:MASE1 domain-containing protein n=1 Tax=Dyella agri TaxID=1926869 RepID=A0ABW8KMR6_9GAMM